MARKDEKPVNNLERIVGRTVLESAEGKPIAEEVMAELTQKNYEQRYGSHNISGRVIGLLKHEVIAAASGAAVGYITDGPEGAMLGAQYGATVYTTLWAALSSFRFLFRKRGVEFEEVSDKCKANANNQIGINLNLVNEPIASAMVAGLAGSAIMVCASYPAEWIGQHLPYVSEVVQNAKHSFGIGALFGIGDFVFRYFSALRSNAKIRRRFTEVASEEQLQNPNLDALLSDKGIYRVAMKQLEKASDILKTPKGKKVGRKKISELIESYYKNNFKSGLTQKAWGFAKQLSITTLAGAAVGYVAAGPEGTLAGAQYAASLYVMIYGAANTLRLLKKSNPSLENIIENCRNKVKKIIDSDITAYRKPIGTTISLTLGMGLIISGLSYLHDWIGSNIEGVNQIVQNAHEFEISPFKIGCLLGLTSVVSLYKNTLSFMKSLYQGLDDAIYSNRPQKARVSKGSEGDLDSFTRTNAEGILETPIIDYMNAAGKRVTYVGAVHIAEAEYFAKLQQELDGHERVFYEAVKKGMAGLLDRISGGAVLLNSLLSRYKRMARGYKLTFQGKEIEYRDSWENVDKDKKAIIDRLNRSRTVAGGIAKQLLFYIGSALYTGISFLADNFLYIPKRKLSQQVSEEEDDSDNLLNNTILKYRNQVVMDRLTQFTQGEGRDVAVFYGAGHLGELHKFVTQNLGYRVQQVRWIEAW